MERPRDPVFICSGCGRGFLIHPGCTLDPVPVWFTSFSQADGPCLGKIVAADPEMLKRNLANARRNDAT